MKLMLTVAYDVLKKRDHATFQELFDAVKEEQKLIWKELFPGELMSKIEVRKMGELFTYLTTDGRFVMIDDSHWTLTENLSHDEVQKLRVNIGENVEREE